jgi:hypothetical protein
MARGARLHGPVRPIEDRTLHHARRRHAKRFFLPPCRIAGRPVVLGWARGRQGRTHWVWFYTSSQSQCTPGVDSKGKQDKKAVRNQTERGCAQGHLDRSGFKDYGGAPNAAAAGHRLCSDESRACASGPCTRGLHGDHSQVRSRRSSKRKTLRLRGWHRGQASATLARVDRRHNSVPFSASPLNARNP